MNKVIKFIKKYWITFCIFLGLVLLYVTATENGWVNPYLFPSTEAIEEAFVSSRGMMLGNMAASFKLLIPSIIVSLIIALVLGTIMGMNKRVREVV